MLDSLRTKPITPMLSAVVTSYLDARAIPLMHERLTRVFGELGVDYEIIFVNDGSPDDTNAVLDSILARDDRVLVIEHSRNFGSQNAFISGMQVSIGDAVVLLDGDLQDPPELIVSFFEHWQLGYEVVYGTRAQRDGSRLFSILARLFYRVFRRISDVTMPLDAGDFGLMDRRVVDVLLELPESDQFVRGLRSWVGFKQTGIAYCRPERVFGRSTHSFLKNFWWAKKAIFSFSFAPLEILGYLAATLTAVSTLGICYQVVLALTEPGFSFGMPALLLVITFMGSLNLLSVALVGEYLMKVVVETKKRPRFIRRAIRHEGETRNSRADLADFLAYRAQCANARRIERQRALELDRG